MNPLRPALLVVEDEQALTSDELASLSAVGLVVARARITATADRPALRELSSALSELVAREDVDAERVAALGLGRCATLALLFACQSSGLAALTMWGGELVRDKLDAEHPFQPLEMALSLEAQLSVHLDSGSAAGSSERIEVVHQAMSQFARSYDIVLHAGDPTQLDAAARGSALEHTLAFLTEVLDASPA